jgi:two-component system, LytTR family, response regulator
MAYSSQLRITNYELRITNYELRITNYELRITNYEFLKAPLSKILNSQFSILNSQFSILNSQFSILNSRFSILNSQFSILNSQFSILNSQFSILNSQFSILNSLTSMKISTIIVEDETNAREVLKGYLAKYCPQIELKGEAENIKTAVPLIREVNPQLVFLDVEMPFGNAFDVLEACEGMAFKTIFVTAFSEYALRALNLSAAYYLLKPLSIEELILAVNKVQEELLKQDQFDKNKIIVENFKEKNQQLQQLTLPTMEGFDVVKIEQIVQLKGNGNFTDIFINNGSKKMVCRFLKHFEELLPYEFVRVHKSHIINIQYIKSYSKSAGGYITMSDGSEVSLSPNYKETFLKSFGG